MKAIKCEMCGSSDFQKVDGMYVCQHCKTKYTVEDANKLMVEIDDSKKLANLYERARKSLEVNDLVHAAEYFKEILDSNPQDWEAYFYAYLGEFASFTNAEAASVVAKLGSTIPPAYDMAIRDCGAEEAAARVQTITVQSVARVLGVVSCAYALLKQYERGSVLTAEGNVRSQLYAKMRPLAQQIVLASIATLDSLGSKIRSLEGSGIAPDVIKGNLLVVFKNKYEIANHTYYANEVRPEKLIKQEFIRKYAQEVIDLGGFATCKGEEIVVLQMDKAKAVLVQPDGKKAGGGKGKIVLTNYKLTYDTGKPKKSFELSVSKLYHVGVAPFSLVLGFTDGTSVNIRDTFADKNAHAIKSKLGL